MSIGFNSSNQSWAGRVTLDLAFYSDHTRTTRYDGYVERSPIHAYVHKIQLGSAESPPQKIRLTIRESDYPHYVIGFTASGRSTVCSREGIEYTWKRSTVYATEIDGHEEVLYIPRETFGLDEPPQRILVTVELIS